MNLVGAAAEAAVGEAARLIAAQALGSLGQAGTRLLSLFQRKCGQPGLSLVEVERQVFAAAREDPGWAVELVEVLAETTGGEPVLGCESLLHPFRDRRDALARVPETGVFVIAGAPGSGRRTLTRKIASDRRDRFPGGCLAVDTDLFRRGRGELAIGDVQRHILGQCGVSRDDQADAVADLAAQFTRAMASRRLMLILHGLRGADEVRPFEPGSPLNLVLVTTGRLGDDLRSRYATVLLRGLDPDGAWQLLADKCGPDMLLAEQSQAHDLLTICDYLPEPITLVGGRLSAHRDRPGAVGAMVARLRSGGLAGTFDPVRRTVEESLAELPDEARAACALLAAHPGPDFDHHTAKALLGVDDAQPVLDTLDDAGMLVPAEHGRARLRHAFREHAAAPELPEAAFTRLLRFLRDCAVVADHAEDRSGEQRLRVYPGGHGPAPVSSAVHLFDYLDQQRHVLLETVRHAYARGHHEEVCQLGGALEVLVTKYGGYEWYIAVNELVLASAQLRLAEHDSDERRKMVVRAHAMHGRAHFLLHILDRAEDSLRCARDELAKLRTRDARLEASLCEFWGRFHQISAEHARGPGLHAAITELAAALRHDRELGDERAVLIHARMLANVLIDAGRLREAWPLLDEAAGTRNAHGRNLARVQMVRAKAALREGAFEHARWWWNQARELLGEKPGPYRWELAELDAELVTATGPVEVARQRWGVLAQEAWQFSHPRMYRYLGELERLNARR
ncbi:NB-ARC domain-containing protein [Saccharomonospora sp. NPDC046836]|uniref:NB-ARC domain-containing protein n=1 Tax=Saccharomonospora sp. NPDC046836 TaxID=3156921 RepID=UPI0033CD33B6